MLNFFVKLNQKKYFLTNQILIKFKIEYKRTQNLDNRPNAWYNIVLYNLNINYFRLVDVT